MELIRCSGKRCPMQHNKFDVEECELYDKCEYYTSKIVSDDRLYVAMFLGLMIIDENANVDIEKVKMLYSSLRGIENDQCYVGFGTYNPKVFSRYLKEYFIEDQTLFSRVKKKLKVLLNCLFKQ